MFARSPVALALLALHAPLIALAQSSASPAKVDEVVVTGSRFAESAANAVRPVQVIDAQAIADSGVTSLPELLASLGGVESVTSGGLGQAASIFIRGANSNHSVVLVDGVRIGSPTSGTAALASLPLALIERIEVLPGAASSLYGADAIGGVIQVFTRRAGHTPTASVAATLGEQGLRQLATSYARRMGDTELSLGANLLRTAGINATTPDNTYSYNADRDGYLNRSALARLSQQFGEHSASLQWLRSNGKQHFDDGPTGDSVYNTLTQTVAAQWTGPLAPQWRSELRLARAWDESTSISNFPGKLATYQDQLSWLNHLNLGAGQLSAGVEWLNQQIAPSTTTAYSAHSRDIGAAMLGWRAGYGSLAVQADARYDDNSQFGGHSTGQLGTTWQLNTATRLRASVGTAFKAPTFNDLYAPAAWGSNATLKPESSTSIELGADWRDGDTALHATLFDNRIDNLIAADANWQLQNIAHAQTRGLTLGANATVARATQLRLNLSVQDPKDRDTDTLLLRRARVFGDLQLSHQMGQVRLGTTLHASGERNDFSTRMGGYGLVAVYAAWQFQPTWSLEGRVNNLGDKAYTLAQGYATSGRAAQMTLRWTPAL
jgi:vitamin B12 transporter